MFYSVRVQGCAQMSLFSAEANPPRVADLAGMLCGPGEMELFGRGSAARLMLPVDGPWRLMPLRAELSARGLHGRAVRVERDEVGGPVIRTAFRSDLTGLAAAWFVDGVKTVPDPPRLDGGTLRLWALGWGAAGERGFRLTLDPRAPGTHEPLQRALRELGVPTRPVRQRDGSPALLVRGRRRLERFAELVGPAPAGAVSWPGHEPTLTGAPSVAAASEVVASGAAPVEAGERARAP